MQATACINISTMQKTSLLKGLAALAALAAVGGGAAMATMASADTTTATTTTPPAKTAHPDADWKGGMGVFGTIASVSGNTLTVTGKAKDGTSTTYTVDATNTKIVKAVSGAKPAAATLADLKVGDTVAVRGTVSGTSVTATQIMDGMPPFGKGFAKGFGRGHGPMKPMGVGGKVTAVSGNTLTLSGKNGTTQTVQVQVGDMVNVIHPTTTTTASN